MESLVWVRIETTKSNDDVWSFKGQIVKSKFEQIVSNQISAGYFRLENVYWVAITYDEYGNKQGEELHRYGKEKLKDYKGDLYLKIEHLVSLAPIDGEMELSRFRKAEKKPLNLVSPIR